MLTVALFAVVKKKLQKKADEMIAKAEKDLDVSSRDIATGYAKDFTRLYSHPQNYKETQRNQPVFKEYDKANNRRTSHDQNRKKYYNL